MERDQMKYGFTTMRELLKELETPIAIMVGVAAVVWVGNKIIDKENAEHEKLREEAYQAWIKDNPQQTAS
jgi:hypothetical protein